VATLAELMERVTVATTGKQKKNKQTNKKQKKKIPSRSTI
jgi:hypothetical protein